MSPHVVIRHLSKRYGESVAVREVSFTVERGEIFGLLGPNGAGKTTTLECLVGLREPDAGELTVGGLDVCHRPRDAKQRIGVVLQETALPDKLTPREALRLFGSFYQEREAPAALLERFGLTEKADICFDALSGGQRQRLALALAFVNRPELVVLDEPTTGLDPQSRRDLHEQIVRMKQEGRTVLLSTHHLEEAERWCDRIAIIDRGVVIAIGAPRDLIAQSSARQSVQLISVPRLENDRLMRLPGVKDLEWDENTVRFRTTQLSATLAALAALLNQAGAEVIDLHVRKMSLEEVFLSLTREQEDARR